MLVLLEDSETTADLGEFLHRAFGAIVERPRLRELEVSMVGSFSDDALRDELRLAIKRWSFVRRRPDAVILVG